MIVIRTEMSKDQEAIHQVNKSAFGRINEADLVDTLRRHSYLHISLVAIIDNQVVGHIFFSPVSIELGDSAIAALGLGPMAVLPEFQNQGIRSKLVREGLEECKRIGYYIVVVLGHSQYYPKFGFVPAKTKGLRSEYNVADEV